MLQWQGVADATCYQAVRGVSGWSARRVFSRRAGELDGLDDFDEGGNKEKGDSRGG